MWDRAAERSAGSVEDARGVSKSSDMGWVEVVDGVGGGVLLVSLRGVEVKVDGLGDTYGMC